MQLIAKAMEVDTKGRKDRYPIDEKSVQRSIYTAKTAKAMFNFCFFEYSFKDHNRKQRMTG